MIRRWKITLHKASAYWKVAFELLLITIFILYGVNHWSEIHVIIRRISPLTLCMCMSIYTLSHFVAAATARTLFDACGHPIPYRTLLYIHIRRLPAKYVPGGIWQTVSRGTDLVQLGIPTRAVIQILSLEQLLAIWWAGFLGFLLVGATFNIEKVRMAAFIIAFALLAGAVSAMFLLDKFKPNSAHLSRAARTPKACVGYVAGWCCLACAFTAYLWLDGLNHVAPLQIAASYLVSWMLGAMALFAPQGIGVFELVMQRAIFQSHGNAMALWLIGSYRLVVLSADLLAWAVGTSWHRVKLFTNNASESIQ